MKKHKKKEIKDLINWKPNKNWKKTTNLILDYKNNHMISESKNQENNKVRRKKYMKNQILATL